MTPSTYPLVFWGWGLVLIAFVLGGKGPAGVLCRGLGYADASFSAWVLLFVLENCPAVGPRMDAPIWYWVFVLLGCDFGILIVLFWVAMQQT